MKSRTSIFSVPQNGGGMDLSKFKPAPKNKDTRPAPEEIDRISEGSRFVSRESASEPEKTIAKAENNQGARKPRAYRTGRHRVVSVKTTNEHAERFYELADKLGLKVAETFELAVAALERDNLP
ncbi:hypothetical protein QMA67_14735 [Gluconobacter japonicus]|uniref:hypothetical protein n=1 Tax=Gluconobacter TaxID=441 RepID=UPI001B8CF80A|nr:MULTISPECIES: hypothetical protein [Gluconobacter]MBS0995507.1 hypothetical protein [Gluconobacter cerinus]MDI6654178.1 hypothetical protein [Gluconobacter japonicus]